MGGKGPPPSASRRRTNKQPPGVAVPTVTDDEVLHGPELGLRPGYVVVEDKITRESRRVKLRWLPNTLEWWDTWRRSPQAAALAATDWLELKMTALLVDDAYRGETKNASEIRLRVAQHGATLADRQRLRMTFGSPTPRENSSGGGGASARPADEVSARRARLQARASGT